MARRPAKTKKALFKSGIKRKLRKRFPGFAELYRFRNDISHGIVNASADSVPKALRLRTQAKEIVEELFKIVEKRRGRALVRDAGYFEALARR